MQTLSLVGRVGTGGSCAEGILLSTLPGGLRKELRRGMKELCKLLCQELCNSLLEYTQTSGAAAHSLIGGLLRDASIFMQ